MIQQCVRPVRLYKRHSALSAQITISPETAPLPIPLLSCCLHSTQINKLVSKILRPLTAQEVDHHCRRTIDHYQQSASAFRTGTADHDVKQNIESLIKHIRGRAPFRILDLGCGPGRDLAAFVDLGHQPVGLDGCEAFVHMANQLTGCPVWHQSFDCLELPTDSFDGIFANASLFHVPSQILDQVLRQLNRCLKADGVLFASNPRGPDIERDEDERYATFLSLATWQAFVQEAGFSELEHYYRPAGKPRDQQPWLASVWRKISQMDVLDDSSTTLGRH